MIADAKEVLDTGIDILKNDPAGLLCDKPNCELCPRRKQVLIDLQ